MCFLGAAVRERKRVGGHAGANGQHGRSGHDGKKRIDGSAL